jgi:hypothetical protein
MSYYEIPKKLPRFKMRTGRQLFGFMNDCNALIIEKEKLISDFVGNRTEPIRQCLIELGIKYPEALKSLIAECRMVSETVLLRGCVSGLEIAISQARNLIAAPSRAVEEAMDKALGFNAVNVEKEPF